MDARGRLMGTLTPPQWEDISRAVRAIGPDVSPATVRESGALIAPLHGPEGDERVTVLRDEPYGPHDRQRLDLFLPSGRPPTGVVVFVHGGAFVAGSKHTEGTPYHDNIGRWCVSTGRAAVTMNYRLAPSAPWPAAAEDVDAVVAWSRARVRAAGAPVPVHLSGTSSGAVHVATYLTGGPGWRREEGPPASAAFFSGVYDLAEFGIDRVAPYFGREDHFLAAGTLADRLVDVPVPMLFAVGEWDTPEANVQFARAVGAFAAAGRALPALARCRAANHFTIVNAIGTPVDDLGPSWRELMDAAEHGPGPAAPAEGAPPAG